MDTRGPAEISVGAPNYPVLNAFMGCRERVSVIIGPLGSGKTYGCAQRMLTQMIEQEPNEKGERRTRWLAVRNTYPDLMTTTIRDFLSIFEGCGTMRYGGAEPPSFEVHRMLPDGTRVRSEVIFLALDREDAVRKLRGTQITGVWLNEIKELSRGVVDMADLRHGRYPSSADGGVRCTWHGMLGDCNAPDEDHWLYRLAEEERPAGWVFFRQPGGLIDTGELLPNGSKRWIPNPHAENLDNLPEGYYERGAQGKSDDWIRVLLANEYGFTIEGRPVHPQYVDSVHTSPERIQADPHHPLVVGVDFGRTPTAVFCQYLEAVGRWVILDELGATDMSAAVFGPELKRYIDRLYPGFAVQAWGDPAGDHAGQATEDTPIRILRAAGIPIEPAPSNEPSLRRAAIANPCTRLSMDGKPGLLVSPKARMTRKGLMGGFCYRRLKVTGQERYTDQPDKNEYSHFVEAAEYALLGGGEGREALLPAPYLRDSGPRQEWAIDEPYEW